jgi:hypothetical protein
MTMAKITDYPFEIRPLSAEDGGGFLVSFPVGADRKLSHS